MLCEGFYNYCYKQNYPLNRNTTNAYFNELRSIIFEESLLKKDFGEFECDESYFLLRNPLDEAKRLRGKLR